ncbi:LOB domain-containing protein 1 [Vitis vinifera]|uniref:LOB domain-containing protein 1 n=1 Tax=Vitis vinifera TaxID=29760 RepID=A0A438CGZ5_VITVI|nr:LOB domain-containing protein 1 [Vitis vinifera]
MTLCDRVPPPSPPQPTAYRLPPPPSLLPLPPLLEMESAENNKAPGATVSTPLPFSPTSSSNSGLPRSPPALVVLSPCAACKILRRRCADKCVLAPYFPPTEPLKFTIAHRVFGASNIIKLLQDLPESQRADAVSSMVYEANARIRDPVYGCAGAICHLQKQVSELQAQLAKAQADVINMQCQQDNLVAILCMDFQQQQQQPQYQQQQQQPFEFNGSFFLEDGNLVMEPLWT